MVQYKNAPIGDAVIQLQFAEILSDRDMERLAKKAEANYPANTLMRDFQVEIRASGESAIPSIKSVKKWYRLTTTDGADVFMVTENTITSGRLSPYRGWERLFSNQNRDFEMFRKILGPKTFTRIGVRFVNRIDIPKPKNGAIDIRDYLNIYPAVPVFMYNNLGAPQQRLEYDDDESGAKVVVTSGLVDPVLINRQSYLLDIDVIRLGSIPVNQKELLEGIDALRIVKNRAFEALITDRTRELINA